MSVKISLYLMRQDEAVTEDAVAVPLAGLALVKVMLTGTYLLGGVDGE